MIYSWYILKDNINIIIIILFFLWFYSLPSLNLRSPSHRHENQNFFYYHGNHSTINNQGDTAESINSKINFLLHPTAFILPN